MSPINLVNGHRFRALTVVDVFTRESLAIEGGQSLRDEHVVTVRNRLTAQRGAPTRLWCDNVLYLEVKRAEQAHLSCAAATAAN